MLFLLTDPPQKSKLEKIRGNLIIFVYVSPKKEVAMSPKIGRMNIFYHWPARIVEYVSEYMFLVKQQQQQQQKQKQVSKKQKKPKKKKEYL